MLRPPLFTLGLVVLLPAVAAGEGFQARIDAFLKKAATERQQLGLEGNAAALAAQYPRASVTSSERPVQACPGKTAKVRLDGNFLPGTVFIARSDEVQVTKERGTSGTWLAEVHLNAGLTPRTLKVAILTPVSGEQEVVSLVEVACQFEWSVDLNNGDSVTVRAALRDSPLDDGEGTTADAQWAHEGKAMGSTRVVVGGSEQSFRLRRHVTSEERAARAAAVDAANASPDMKAIDDKLAAANTRAAACARGNHSLAQGCLTAAREDITWAEKRRAALLEKAMAHAGMKFGCDEVTLSVDAKGRVTGNAKGCAVNGTAQVAKGALRPVAP